MNDKSRSLVAVSLVLALLGPAPAAVAEPSASDVATAKSLVVEGRVLREKGQHASARDRFKAAWALIPTPIIGMDLAREHVALGELVEAREVAASVTRLPPKPNETEEGKAARVQAEKLVEELEPRIPSLVLIVKPKSEDVAVLIDGSPIPNATLGVARRLNPGKHTVIVRAGAKEKRRTVTLSEGQKADLVVDLGEESDANASGGIGADSASGAEKPKPPVNGTAGETTSAPIWPWFAIGGGAVGAVLGVKFGLDWADANSTYRAQCPTVDCTDRERLAADRDRARTYTIITGIIGAAGITVGTIGLLSHRSAPGVTATASLLVTPAGIGGVVTF